MKKELKYFFYVITIFFFLFYVVTYYFSDKNKKNSYRSLKLYEDKIQSSQSDLKILENDTNNIIFYNENNSNKGKKKYNFWNLLSND